MGNLVSQGDIEGDYKRFCEELVANDPKNKSGCFHWGPPLKTEQFDHFTGCLSKNNCLNRLNKMQLIYIRAHCGGGGAVAAVAVGSRGRARRLRLELAHRQPRDQRLHPRHARSR